jgi:hypothetical protein
VGSRSKIAKKTDLAYIAGFLDGDGSLMLQLKKRSDSKRGIRFMATICFYQDSRHEKDLNWIRKILGIGYLSKRKDGMSELRINSYKRVGSILESLIPFIRFKKTQACALKNACEILSNTKFKMLDKRKINRLIEDILIIQVNNYTTRKKKTKDELFAMFGLTP